MSDQYDEMVSQRENPYNISREDRSEYMRSFIDSFLKFKDNFFRTTDNRSSYYTYPKQVTGRRGETMSNLVVGSGNNGNAGP